MAFASAKQNTLKVWLSGEGGGTPYWKAIAERRKRKEQVVVSQVRTVKRK